MPKVWTVKEPGRKFCEFRKNVEKFKEKTRMKCLIGGVNRIAEGCESKASPSGSTRPTARPESTTLARVAEDACFRQGRISCLHLLVVSRSSCSTLCYVVAPEVGDSDNMVRGAKLLSLPINRRREPEVGISDSIEPKTSRSCREATRLDRRISLQCGRRGCDWRFEVR